MCRDFLGKLDNGRHSVKIPKFQLHMNRVPLYCSLQCMVVSLGPLTSLSSLFPLSDYVVMHYTYNIAAALEDEVLFSISDVKCPMNRILRL